MKEYILCSANHYDDGTTMSNQPINIKTGFIICGRRHNNCIGIFAKIFGLPYDEKTLEIKRTEIQGFLTNTNRFVSREEAAQIAFDSGQITQHKILLFSEDLY